MDGILLEILNKDTNPVVPMLPLLGFIIAFVTAIIVVVVACGIGLTSRNTKSTAFTQRVALLYKKGAINESLRALSGAFEADGFVMHGAAIVVRSGAIEPDLFFFRHKSLPRRLAMLRAVQDVCRSTMPIKKDMVLHVSFMDDDVWYISNRDKKESVLSFLRGALKRGLPLFWLHVSPAVDVTTGRLPPQTLPIPHEEALTKEVFKEDTNVNKQMVDALPGVAWRGASTGFSGFEGGYKVSDRYRLVAAAQGLQRSDVDVAFSKRVQGVTEEVVPKKMVGGFLPPAQMSNRRVVIDVDGNTAAWESLRWKLAAGKAVLKIGPSRFVQWYYPELINGQHLRLCQPTTAALEECLSQMEQPAVNRSLRQQALDFARSHLTVAAARAALKRAVTGLLKAGETPSTLFTIKRNVPSSPVSGLSK